MKKILIAFLLLFGWISAAFAENFYIENYDITLNVDKKNNVYITENIDTYFTHPSHGIYRKIPHINNVVRADGSKSTVSAKVSDVKVSENYSLSKDISNYEIKIGYPDRLITGEHSYNLKYRYSLYNTNDEFYFNIIGTGWDTDIRHVNFKVQMPKDFPYDKVGMSVGQYGTVGFNKGLQYSVNQSSNTIEGYTTKTLNPHEAITIRIELPKNYFYKKFDFQKPVCILLISVFTFISFIYWYLYGKDEKTIPVVNFYPPEDYNSALVGLIYKENADLKQVVSLIIYLADKGYIKIQDEGKKVTLFKNKEYDDDNYECKSLMNALFKNGKNEVTTSELEVSTEFYKDCEKIVKHLEESKKFIYEKNSIAIGVKYPLILSIIGLFLIFYCLLVDFEFITAIVSSTILMLIFPIIAICIFVRAIKSFNGYSKFFKITFALMYGVPPLIGAIGINAGSLFNNGYILMYCAIGLIISGICLYQMPKKNKLGLKYLGHILGYRKFLQTAEKSRIKELVKSDPQYCFNMLPYAYVLGVSDEWIKKFESVINYNPDWYTGNFNYTSFNNFTHSLHSASAPSTANGGISTSSSGGGGFSGGGCGGGGGGSW